jgi:tetratricopeptide (TPR) repeat protein
MTVTETALQQATFAMQNGHASEAERIAGEILSKSPANAHAAHIYGYALHVQGREEESIAPLERAVQQNHSPVLETQLGIALRRVGRIDDALKPLRRAISRQPPFPPAFLEYGSLLLQLRRWDEAIAILERGLALAPNFAEMLAHLGSGYAARGEKTKAIDAFTRVLATAPNDPETLFNLAYMMKNSCCFAQAAELFKRVLATDSTDSVARMALGVCLLESGMSDAGFDNLSIACKTDVKLLGPTVNALAFAGRGRFWLRPSAAEKFLKSRIT